MIRESGSLLHVKTPNISLDAAGLVALADLTTIQQRTALTGDAVLCDIFVICPGIHAQKGSVSLNGGEYPACAALTSGYVFRIENPATVYYLQQVGRTGFLTTLEVGRLFSEGERPPFWSLSTMFSHYNTTVTSTLAYATAVIWSITVIVLVGAARDWWALGMIFLLMLSRLGNVLIIRRRARGEKWSGASEEGEQGDLLVLLSQDRWIRMKGAVDDLKKCTSGQWLRDESNAESWITALATLLVYLAAALTSNAELFGQILILCLLIGNAGLLAIANFATKELQMHGIKIKVLGEPVKYRRRRDLADALVEETKRDDWAVRMGMIVKDKCPKCSNGCDCVDTAAVM
ncbi:uncharacterized protein DNG_05053 [Cephalotrichum gorgonifer]|uniref:Uncharacterized protein n=1 Tax=Cephalotrichum gorgonifer TaxID=2041049 RepID=A0AAE8N025_9PEZI|nr:uncharacterized protein DNG_05053 [Cephalotrichum gorgonifer]